MDVAVIIRAAGERTLGLCKALVEKQVSPDRVHLVQAAPFEVALRECYQKGIDVGAKWTLTLDADVLVRPGALADLISRGDRCQEQVFHLHGRVYDKLLLCDRKGGLRLYRTSLLSQVLSNIPPEGAAVRPESQTVKGMERAGWRSEKLDIILGIHDYEQYYRDVYRKAMLHAHKHLHLASAVVSRWKQWSQQDFDYVIAIRGYCDGLLSDKLPSLDSRAFPAVGLIIEELRLAEKDALTGNRDEVERFQDLIDETLRNNCAYHSQAPLSAAAMREEGLGHAVIHATARIILYGARRLHALGAWMEKERR